MHATRPTPNDADAFYFTYIDQAPDGNVVELLDRQLDDTLALVAPLDEEGALYRYQPGKWSIKQVLGHLADAERVFSYRALAFSRGDTQPIPGMDQDVWIGGSRFDEIPVADLAAELRAVRHATVALLGSLSEDQWLRRGVASDCEIQVGALPWIIAGHEIHHRRVLADRYSLES